MFISIQFVQCIFLKGLQDLENTPKYWQKIGTYFDFIMAPLEFQLCVEKLLLYFKVNLLVESLH